MKEQELHNTKYNLIKIVRGGTTVVAILRYAVDKRAFIAEMPPSNTVGTLLAESIKLTDEMIGRIVCEQDGTIRLDL